MKLAVVVFLLCLVCEQVFAGPQEATAVRLLQEKPSVYMEFVRDGHRDPLYNGESDSGVWLRLHNNTKWSIVLQMNGYPSEDYGDAAVIYDVLSEGQTKIDGRCHVCSVNPLGSGRSLVFSVPAEHLSKRGGVRVKFSYDWEDSHKVTAGLEPEHWVYFYTSQLPKNQSETQVRSNRVLLPKPF